MDPVSPSKMYALTWPSGRFAATTDGGATWHAADPSHAVDLTTRRLSVDSCGTVWANPGPPILSGDGGSTWQAPDVDWPMGEFTPMPEQASSASSSNGTVDGRAPAACSCTDRPSE